MFVDHHPAQIGLRVLQALDPGPTRVRLDRYVLHHVFRELGTAAQHGGEPQQPRQLGAEPLLERHRTTFWLTLGERAGWAVLLSDGPDRVEMVGWPSLPRCTACRGIIAADRSRFTTLGIRRPRPATLGDNDFGQGRRRGVTEVDSKPLTDRY
jgi:hypothetical protein